MVGHKFSVGSRPPAPKRWDLFMVSAALLILISVARLHSFVPALSAIRPGLLVTALGVFCLATGHRGARHVRHLNSPLAKLMLLFVCLAIVGVPFGIYGTRSVRFLTGQFLREAVVILVIVSAVRDLNDLRRLLAVFAFGVIGFAVMATGSGGGRSVSGGGYDPNDSAMLIVSGMPLIFYFMVRAKKHSQKILFGLGLAACGSSVVVSGSRGGFLGLVAVMGYSLFYLKGIKPSMRVAVVAIAGIVVISQANAEFWQRIQSITDENDYNRVSYTGREQVWKRGVGYMTSNPFFGVGIDNFSVAEGRHPDAVAMLEQGQGVKFSYPHSIWVQVGAEMGFPGLLTLIACIVMSIRFLWTADQLSRRRSGPDDPILTQLSELGRPLIGVLIGMAVAGTFLSRAYSALVWMPIGLALVVVKLTTLRQRDLARAAAAARMPLAHPRQALVAQGSVPQATAAGRTRLRPRRLPSR